MDVEINVPEYQSTRYELWKKEIEAWTTITELSKEKQAIAVALSLPEDDKIKEPEDQWSCKHSSETRDIYMYQ